MDTMEGQIRKIELETCSQAEFDAEMEAIDEVLRSGNVPIPARELQAVQQICMRNGFSLGLHEPLAGRLREWFGARYGDRLKMDISLGFAPILIRGDAYRLRIPPLFFGGRVIASPKSIATAGGIPTINVVDLIDDLPAQVRGSLGASELGILLRQFAALKEQLERISMVRSEEGYKTAFGDLQAASDNLTKEQFEVGLSRWSTLQFCEKFLKAWLREKGVAFPKTHDLGRLANLAEANGMLAIDRADLATVQCLPDVRYDATGLTMTDAVSAYFAALRLADHVVRNRRKVGAR